MYRQELTMPRTFVTGVSRWRLLDLELVEGTICSHFFGVLIRDVAIAFFAPPVQLPLPFHVTSPHCPSQCCLQSLRLATTAACSLAVTAVCNLCSMRYLNFNHTSLLCAVTWAVTAVCSKQSLLRAVSAACGYIALKPNVTGGSDFMPAATQYRRMYFS